MNARPLIDDEQEALENLVDHDLLERARRDAEWHMRLELPSPKKFANGLPLYVAQALCRIYQNGQKGWQAREADAPLLRRYGLVEARGRGVGAYGLKVYRALGGKSAL